MLAFSLRSTCVLCVDEGYFVSPRLDSNKTTFSVHWLVSLCMKRIEPVENGAFLSLFLFISKTFSQVSDLNGVSCPTVVLDFCEVNLHVVDDWLPHVAEVQLLCVAERFDGGEGPLSRFSRLPASQQPVQRQEDRVQLHWR